MYLSKDCNGKTDEELVDLTLQNKEYFVCIIDRYEDNLLRYIRRITNIAEDELYDILQETFVNVYYNLNGFDRSLKFSSWIYRIAHNKTISVHRKNKVRPHGNLIDFDEKVLENLADDFDVTKDIDIRYLRQNIEKILDKLDEKYKEVLILRFFEEKDYKEISDILKKPIGTVATLISRAKKQFREEFNKENINLHYE